MENHPYGMWDEARVQVVCKRCGMTIGGVDKLTTFPTPNDEARERDDDILFGGLFFRSYYRPQKHEREWWGEATAVRRLPMVIDIWCPRHGAVHIYKTKLLMAIDEQERKRGVVRVRAQ